MTDFQRNLAVIIGINKYGDGISPLETAVNDATELAKILKTEHNYEVSLLSDEGATLETLQHLLTDTLPKTVAADDRLLFYFAGHGIALNGEDGPEGYLIPQNARLGDVKSYLSMVELHDRLNELPCRHLLAILDCCFAGAFRWSSTRHIGIVPEVIHRERFDRFIADPAWQVITSSASDQKALDALSLTDANERGKVDRNSPFAAALIEAFKGKADIFPPSENGRLPGDGAITATELYLYLRDRVEVLTERHHHRQTPGLWLLQKHDKGEYIFLNPGHPLNLPPAPPLDASKNPYRGLEPFESQHQDLFFGRTDLIRQLAEFVSDRPFTVVLGASGSGKSSLVKAGLIPHLQTLSDTWKILPPFRPCESPLKALDRVLGQISPDDSEKPSRDLQARFKTHPGFKLLLVIDQFEELITLCDDEREREAFLDILADAIRRHPDSLRIVVTLRSDFEPQFQDIVLKDNWNSGRFIVPPMTRNELREAIEKPAEARVMYFESDDPQKPLVDRIADEVADMPGALSLLSFTLSELYLKYLQRQREAKNRGETIDRSMTEADYRELGGVAQSLTRRGDREYETLVAQDKAYETVICQVMLRMVAVGGGDLARRRVPLSELEYPPEKNRRVKTVLERFTAARLLVEGQDLEGNPCVEPAHDILVRGWSRLLVWQQESEENLLLQRRLTPAAREWLNRREAVVNSGFSAGFNSVLNEFDRAFYAVENVANAVLTYIGRWWLSTQKSGRSRQEPAEFLWNANPYLDVLKEQLQAEDNDFNRVEAEFVGESLLRRRRNVSWRWRLAIAIFLSLSGLTAIALFNLRNAQIRQAQAYRESAETNLIKNNSLDGAVESLRSGRSLQHNLVRIFPPDPDIKMKITGTLQEAVYIVRERDRFDAHQGTARSKFSPDGRLIATAGSDGIVRLWDSRGWPIQEWDTEQELIFDVSFSPDGLQLATAGRNGTVRLWNLQGQLSAELTGHMGMVKGVDFSPDGEKIATAGMDRTVRLWNLRGQQLAVMNGHTDMIWSVAFSPDGQSIVSVAEDDTIRFWNLQGQPVRQLQAGQGELHDVEFSPDGQTLVTGGRNGTVYLWNLKGEKLRQFEGHQGRVWGVSFSPDGGRVGSAAADGTVRFWNLQGRQLLMFDGHEGPVRSVAFSPDGLSLNSGGDDGSVRLWDLRDKAIVLEGHRGSVRSLAFGPDGQLATTGEDGTIRFWDENGRQFQDFEGHQNPVRSVKFSPDGQKLVGDAEKMIRLWNLQGELLSEFEGHEKLIRRIQFSPDGQQLVSSGDDGVIRIWDLKGELLREWEGDRLRIWDVAFSPDGRRVASVGNDGIVKLWNLQGELLESFSGHLGPAYSVAFNPDGGQLVSSGQDGTVRVWDIQNRSNPHLFQVYNAEVNSVAFSPDGKLIVSGDSRGNLQLWSLELGEQFAAWTAHPYSIMRQVSFSPDGQKVATSADDGTAKLWTIASFEASIEKICDRNSNYLENNRNVNGGDRRLCEL